MLDFVAFVELNVTAVRKILKKHDKNVPGKQFKLSQRYLATYYTSHDTDSHLHQLYHYGGLSALVATLQIAFEQLYHLECDVEYQLQQHMTLASVSTTAEITKASYIKACSMPEYTSSDDDDWEVEAEADLSSIYRHAKETITERAIRTTYSPQTNSPHRRHFLIPTTIRTFRRDPILEKIQMARLRLQQSTKYVEVVAAQALMFEEQEEEDDLSLMAMEQEVVPWTRRQAISSFLNLTSTFLYMTNYYIVAPTSGQYALRLGSTPAMAGIIIGMNSNSALLATILYAWWSNHSYKPAFLFAAACSLVGNICYALGLSQHSLSLVLWGRFLNGFGSARSINRRFIADNFPKRQRTAASADFVTAGALGTAAGPAIAALLGRLLIPSSIGTTMVDQAHVRRFASDATNHLSNGYVDSSLQSGTMNSEDCNLLWTVETAPGWIMFGLWSIFWIATFYLFEEPDRSNLLLSTANGCEVESSNGSAGEKKPLLPRHESDSIRAAKCLEPHNTGSYQQLKMKNRLSCTSVFRSAAVPMTLWIYFILKLVLESLLSSSSILTAYYFQWNSELSGDFMAFLGLLMFPANMVVARLSHHFEDRELIFITLLLLLVSVVGFLVYTPTYSVVQYIMFGICIFLTTNVLEGPNMSLLSKTIPKAWAKGTFNSGFLATEAGTAARSVGDLLISAVGQWYGFENLLNCTFIPLLLLVLSSILLVRRYYHRMVDDDDDDEDESIGGSGKL